MPVAPFIAIALGASGALAAGGAAIATAIGLGTVSTAAATAIGAGAFAGLSTAVQGGKASDVLKSAVLGGITSYAGSAIAGSIGSSVESAAKGLDPGIASAMGRVAGSAVAGAISSGTSALLSGRDPIDALLRGGLTAAMSATVGAGVDALLKDVPALSSPLNNQEAALQRATKAAIGTAIVSGGNADAIGLSILNSFAATAGQTIGSQLRDTSSQLSTANEQFKSAEREYTSNLEKQNQLVADYNSKIAPLQQSAEKVNSLIKQYDEVAKNYNNYDSWMKSQGYEQRTYNTEDSSENYWVKRGQLLEKNALFTGIDDYGNPVSWRQDRYAPDQNAPDSISKDALYKQAKAIDAQAVAESNAFNELKTKLLGGEVTKTRQETRMETQMQWVSGYDGEGYYSTQIPVEVPVTVDVPYKEKVEGSLTPIQKQLEELKAKVDPLGQNLVEAKTNLENAVANFNTTETANAAVVDQQIKNFTTARNQYKAEFGVDPTEEQLTNFASTGDIVGAVSKIVADNRNENFAKESGFKNYADFTAAGQVSPNDFYAKQQGWQNYAQQLTAQNNGYNNPNEWNTHINNQQTAVDNGFANYQDYQAAAGTPSNDFYAKKEGWTNYAEKSQASDAGFRSPTAWNTYTTNLRNDEAARSAGFPDYATQQQYGGDRNAYVTAQNESAAKAAGFPDYATQQQYGGDRTAYITAQNNAAAQAAGFPDFETQTRFGNNVNEYKAVQEGWQSLSEKQAAAGYEITSPQKYQEFISGKTEEDKIVQMLRDRGIPATPERVADIMKAWDFNPTTPNVGFSDAFNQSDKLNISNSRADSVQEAAALAKSLGYSTFSFGGSDYKLNTTAPAQNPYDFFASFGEAYKAARADLGAGKNFEWTNPATGETKTFSTNNEKEQAVADQKRIDLMPAYTGEGAYTRMGNPGVVDNIYFDKGSGNVVQDTRVWDQDGKLVSGEIKNINPNASGSMTERLAASLKESFGKTFDAFKYVTSGINKGGWELLNQIGVLGGLTGLVDMDNWATKTAADMKKVIDGYQNKEFLNNRALMNAAIAKAGNEGIFAQAVESAKQFGLNPLQTAEFIAQQGASLFLGGGAMATARALGAGLTAQQAATIGTMAAAQGASVADQAYRDALKNEKTPEEAINAARIAWAASALTSVVANKFIPGALSNEAAIASQNIAKASLSNALRGEVSAELLENTSGQVIANIAAGNPWDKDLGSAIVQSIIASGGVTGLVNVSTIGNPDTAIQIVKDSGLSNNEIENIRSDFQKAIDEIRIQTQNGKKVDSYDISGAVENLSNALRTTGLSDNAIAQVQDLIATDATQEAVKTSLEKSGVPSDFADSIASQSATKILEGNSVERAFADLSTILQANGFSPLDANLITNQTLTGTDVKQVVTDQLKAAGYNPTQAEVNNLISQNAVANPVDIGESVSSYVEPRMVTKEEAAASLAAAGLSNPTDAQINALVGQYDQNLLQSRANTTAGDISTQLSSAEKASFDRDAALSKTLNDISAQVTANQNAGMNADQALNQAITQVATSVGTTKDQLLNQIGQTEQGLKDQIASLQQKSVQDIAGVKTQLGAVESALSEQIAANEASGMARDQAIEKAVTEVAQSVGQSNSALLTLIGQTQETLTQQYASGQLQLEGKLSTLDEASQQRYQALSEEQKLQAAQMAQQGKDLTQAISDVSTASQQQIAGVETKLSEAIESAKASGLAGDAALQSAINKVAGDLGTTKTDLLSQMGKTEEGLRQELATQIGGVQTQIGDVKTSLSSAIADARAAGLQGDQALQSAINTVAGDLGTTKDALLAQIGTTEAGLRQELASQLGGVRTDVAALQAQLNDQGKSLLAQLTQQGMDYGTALQQAVAAQQQQVTDVQKSLTDAMAANEAAGLSRDQATAKAIEDVATSLGTTKDALLTRLGTTEGQLRSEMQAGQALTASQIAGLESQLTDQGRALVAQLQQQGESYQKALSDAIAAQNAQMTAGQQQTAEQIAGVKDSLTAQITANEQAGLSRDEATTKAINDLSTRLGVDKQTMLSQLGTTEQALRTELQSGLAGITKTFQEQYNALNATQKAQFDAMVEQGASTQAALAQMQSGLQQQIGQLGQTQAQQYSQLSQGQKDLYSQLVAQGATQSDALNAAVANLSQSQAQQYSQLSQGQKDLFNQMLSQGASQSEALNSAISGVQGALTGKINEVNQALTQQIAANEAAGLSRDQAISKAVQDVASSVGTTREALLSQIGQTEASLQQQFATGQAQTQAQISQLDAATQARFSQMTEAQQAQALQLAQTTKDLQGSINAVAQQSAQQLAGVSADLQAKLAASDTATQAAFAQMTAAQQAEAAARVQQGQDLQSAIAASQQATQQQITGGLEALSQDFQGKLAASDAATQAAFAQMSAAQQAEAQARVQQGQDLQSAIAASSATAAQQLAQAQAALEGQLSAQGKQFFDALRQQGVDYSTALNQAMEAQGQQFAAGQQALSNQLGALSQASQQQYANLNAAQQQEVAARVAQGESLQNALTSVQESISQQLAQQAQQTQEQISGLSAQTQAQYQALTDAQKAEVANRTAMGEGLEKAIGDVSGQVTGLGGQLSSLQKELEAQKAAEEAYRKAQEDKAAADAAKAAQSAAKAAASSRMSTQSGVLAGLAGLAGAAAVADEEFKPLQGTFLTSKGGQTGYKGLLQDFQQQVEGQPNMADNTMGRQESNDMAPYYSYGNETSLDQILGQENAQPQFFARGGLATPLMAAGGTTGTRYGRYAAGGMPSPLMAAGGKMRVDFRRGDAVTGPGDGQSDDIPAMLADGEFVFPADVVAALGNGSTKAGSDKLYDMMHSIRAHVRSAKPKDLPPEIKSPLDFLKTSKKSRNKRRA